MIGLGLRLTVSGGRDAVIRLVVLAAAVALGVGLLLTAVSSINAVNSQNDRIAWMATGSWVRDGGPEPTSKDPLWWLIRGDNFDGQIIARVDVAATGAASPVPPGIPRLPGPGQYYVSPALAALLRDNPADQLADRYPGRQVGTIGNAALPSPDSLIIVIGHTPARRLADDPRAGFRAVSGLVLALLVTTVAVAVITTQNARRGPPIDGAAASTVLTDQFRNGPSQQTASPASAALLAALRGIGGVTGAIEVRADSGLMFPARRRPRGRTMPSSRPAWSRVPSSRAFPSSAVAPRGQQRSSSQPM